MLIEKQPLLCIDFKAAHVTFNPRAFPECSIGYQNSGQLFPAGHLLEPDLQLGSFTVVAIVEGPVPLPHGKDHLVKSERGVGWCWGGRQGGRGWEGKRGGDDDVAGIVKAY